MFLCAACMVWRPPKVGVPDYRRLVDPKRLRTAGELYRFMVDQFNQTRSFVLELAVVIILIVDLFLPISAANSGFG